MSFPDRKIAGAGNYANAYFDQVSAAAASLDRERLQQAVDILTRVYNAGGTVYSCGNGGSAAIANHLVCDHGKLLKTDTELMPRIYSLSATVEMITAISNDLSYDQVFVYQLRALAKPGDVLVTISASGDSENIDQAAQWRSEERRVGKECRL